MYWMIWGCDGVRVDGEDPVEVVNIDFQKAFGKVRDWYLN